MTSVDTGLVRTATANANGQYRIDTFPTGPVTITVEQPGFQKLVRSGLSLTAADTLTVNLEIPVGNIQETVEVTEAAPLLQSQTATVSTLITTLQMLETPINGRTFNQLILLSSGTAPTQPGGTLTSLTGFSSRANNTFSINGNTAQNNTYLIDGLYNMGLWTQALVMVPTIDSIQEQRLMANAYSYRPSRAPLRSMEGPIIFFATALSTPIRFSTT
ncbi:MAG: carboxypeptidase regulatory-like domain-containing protein [Deltaproteobacteria bacterium]|nr:MAG: carboxypeptidase regulatory-like domain-containing protein [Deltaproteobacteria bacterium]